MPNFKWAFSPDKPSPGFCPPAQSAFHTRKHKDKHGCGVCQRPIYVYSFWHSSFKICQGESDKSLHGKVY